MDVINDVPNSRLNLQILTQQWKKERQKLNNKGVLGILAFEKLTLVITPPGQRRNKEPRTKKYAKTQTQQKRENYQKEIDVILLY